MRRTDVRVGRVSGATRPVCVWRLRTVGRSADWMFLRTDVHQPLRTSARMDNACKHQREKEEPVLCWSGVPTYEMKFEFLLRRTSRLQCLAESGCLLALPYRCPSGECVAASNASQCSRPGCPPEKSFKCPDGSCMASKTNCKAKNGCPLETPFRCPDGTCRLLGAAIPGVAADKYCQPQTVCPAAKPILCADKSCVVLALEVSSSMGCPDVSEHMSTDEWDWMHERSVVLWMHVRRGSLCGATI